MLLTVAARRAPYAGHRHPPEVERNQAGFIVTGPTLETSMPGVFAAGEGATAALMIREYLKGV